MSTETRIMHKIMSEGKTLGWIEIKDGTVFFFKKHAKKATRQMKMTTLLKKMVTEIS